jgi:hypothetical protein
MVFVCDDGGARFISVLPFLFSVGGGGKEKQGGRRKTVIPPHQSKSMLALALVVPARGATATGAFIFTPRAGWGPTGLAHVAAPAHAH